MITSRVNPLVKELAELAAKPQGLRTFAEGYHISREAVLMQGMVRRLICTPEARAVGEGAEISLLAEARCIEIVEVSAECYAKVSRLKSPEGIGVELVLSTACLADLLGDGARLLVAAGVQDPGNAGAMVRVAEAAGASGCVFVGSVEVAGGKFIRAAMGSSLRVPCVRAQAGEFVAAAQGRGVRLYCAEHTPQALPYEEVGYRPPLSLCFGAEGGGMPEEISAAAEHCIYIPMAGQVESLNVAVAAGVVLYHARRFWHGGR